MLGQDGLADAEFIALARRSDDGRYGWGCSAPPASSRARSAHPPTPAADRQAARPSTPSYPRHPRTTPRTSGTAHCCAAFARGAASGHAADAALSSLRSSRLPAAPRLCARPGLQLVDEEGLDAVFEDIAILAGQCRFGDCRHDTEPDCAVKRAVQSGQLATARLEHYRQLERKQRQYRVGAAGRRRGGDDTQDRLNIAAVSATLIATYRMASDTDDRVSHGRPVRATGREGGYVQDRRR